MSVNTNELIALAQKGDERAFEQLFKRHYGVVWGFILKSIRDPHIAEDLTNETFIKAWRGLNRYSLTHPAQFVNWLMTIAQRTAIDYVRSRKCRPLELLVEEFAQGANASPSAETQFLTGTASGPLLAALGKLSKAHQECLVLSYILDMPISSVAEAMNRPQGTIKSMRYYALQALKKDLDL